MATRLSRAERIRLYLADRDVPCERCGYNLRGLTTQKCPECGMRIRLRGARRLSNDQDVPGWAGVAGLAAHATGFFLVLAAMLRNLDGGSVVIVLLLLAAIGALAIGTAAAFLWVVAALCNPRGTRVGNIARGLLVFARMVSLILGGLLVVCS